MGASANHADPGDRTGAVQPGDRVEPADPVVAAFRAHWGRVVAALARQLRDVDRAEEAAAEAFAVASRRWPRDGVPDHPLAWLMATARNRAIDRLRRERSETGALHRLDIPMTTEDPEITGDAPIGDERLELLFCCCHPAVAREAQVALTLRALGGLETDEIAAAFLVAPETMKRRLSRAKAKIRLAGVPFSVPAAEQLPERLATVLAVIYLIFNQGYTDVRADLSAEAIRVGRLLCELMPDESEAHGLLGLMLLHDARRNARRADGQLVRLADQDRRRWSPAGLAAGRTHVARALALRGRGPYVLQAAIAALQAEDPVDWRQVASLYRELAAGTGSPVVRLNLAVAVAEAGDAAAALATCDSLAAELDGYRYLHSTRAELLRRLDRRDEAADAYRRALGLTADGPERRFLEQRLDELCG